MTAFIGIFRANIIFANPPAKGAQRAHFGVAPKPEWPWCRDNPPPIVVAADFKFFGCRGGA